MNIFAKSGIKARIIFTFSILMALLVLLLSRISYLFVKNIYLEQTHDHIGNMSSIIASDLDPKYLSLVGNEQQNLAASFYKEELSRHIDQLRIDNAFIFDDGLDVLVAAEPGISSTRLQLNRKEIGELRPGMLTSSMPFRGEDDTWYLWAYQRLDSRYFLGIQESVDRLSRLDDLSRIFLLIGLAGFGLTIAGGWFLGGTIARPIDRMVAFSDQIGRGNFSAEAPLNITGELQVLRDALIRMRDDLARIQQEREKLLAQVAHEIRNPLGGIELLTGLMREASDSDSKNAVYSDKILEEIASLKNQINAYLNFSRPVQAEPENVFLPELLEKVGRDFRKRLREKEIRLEVNNSIEYIEFDPGHLRQILNNLVANSIQVLESGGRITIACDRQDGRSRIMVSDTGPGIDAEHMDRIFDPFYTTREQGTGLGLSISRKLCRENRAELTAENNDQQGCTFYILQN